jgi:integrase
MPTSYDVRIWTTEKIRGKRSMTYKVVWIVAGRRWKQSHRTAAAAESFRSELMTATRKGEAFDVNTGRPLSMQRQRAPTMTWYEFACAYVDSKWPAAAPKHRKSIAEGLLTFTPVMLTTSMDPAQAKAVRSALLNWGYNTRQRATAEQPPEVTDLLSWVARNSRPLSDIARPDVLRRTLDAADLKLDGTRAAGATTKNKRVVLSNALSYAVELGLLETNPAASVKRSAPRVNKLVDRRSVVNPDQARALLEAVRTTPRSGHLLVAFFATMYYSALRPEEAASLRVHNLDLPDGGGWGWMTLERAGAETDQQWSDKGHRRHERQLKHRAIGDTRRVPVPPELTEKLTSHLADFGAAADGRLFRGEKGRPPAISTYRKIWDRARRVALTDVQYAGPLARRPYDLRHAAVSTWLSAGVPAPQVAEWAGHSVEVLLNVYAKCLDGGEAEAIERIERRLRGTTDTSGSPGA